QTIEKTSRNTGQPSLSARKRSGKNATSLVLPAAIECVQHRLFEVMVKTSREVIRRRKLVINGTGHSANNRHFPCRLNLDFRVNSGFSHVGGGKQCIGRREPASPRRIRIAGLRRLTIPASDDVKGEIPFLHEIHQFIGQEWIKPLTGYEQSQHTA